MADVPQIPTGSSPTPVEVAALPQQKQKLPRMTGKARWGAMASTLGQTPPPEPKKPKAATLPSTEKPSAAEKTPAEVTVQDETVQHFKKKMTKLKFIARLNASARRNSALTSGAGRRTSFDPAEDFHPEARRRFLFDDKALRSGAGVNEIFKSEEPPEEDFNDIVDQDDRRVEVFVSQHLVGEVIDSFSFRMFIFGLIVINSALIGLQTDDSLSVKYRYLFSIFDQAVLATFTCEIILKWYHGFWIFWKVGWNVLDFLIIVALLLGPQLSFLSSSRILRILRVLRAFRSLRSISALAGLSMVVQTILHSVPDMANICLLLFIILVMLGVAGVTLFGRQIPDKFGDLQTAMFSLFVCVTQDGWVQIFHHFKGGDVALHVGGAIYFFVAIMIGAFVFANLVVAVVVTNLEMAMREIEEENKKEEDILSTDVEKRTSEDGHAIYTEDDKVPVLDYEEARKGVDLTAQAPLQLPDLKGLTLDKLEKYFIVLQAIEENLAEYQNIRKDINEMFEMVKSLNDADFGDYDNINMSGKWDTTSFDLDELKRGDIMSNLMKLEERQIIKSDNAVDLGNIMKGAFNPRRRKSATHATSSSHSADNRGSRRPSQADPTSPRDRLGGNAAPGQQEAPAAPSPGHPRQRRKSLMPF